MLEEREAHYSDKQYITVINTLDCCRTNRESINKVVGRQHEVVGDENKVAGITKLLGKGCFTHGRRGSRSSLEA